MSHATTQRPVMWLVSVFLACVLVSPADPSRCPEPRKPHLTSCTIFYNCVNLPGGGYVWVPSRCTEGLVFQPYLRMCVVPGDIWTCDTLSTDPLIVTKPYRTPETIDPADTSYLGYTLDLPEFSGVIDSSYVIDEDTPELTTAAMTAYPLIEFEEPHGETTHDTDDGLRNVSYDKEENYTFEYMHNHWRVPLPLMQRYKETLNDHNRWLNELMSRLQAEPVGGVITEIVSSTRTVAVFTSHKHRQNVSLGYLVHGCTGEVQPQADKPEGDAKPETENVAMTTTESTLQQLISGLDPDNNVIRIDDDLGTRRYLTVDAYKAAAHRLAPRLVSVVACTRNIRLPNRTDCGRYYMCDPRTASVTDYSCPLHTAFNMNSRICDVESAKTCKVDKPVAASDTFIDRAERRNTTTTTTTRHDSEKLRHEEKPCRQHGSKVKDPTSDFRYYICYSAPGTEGVKSIRMTCPNALIFCERKKVCTTKRLCDTSQ